MLKLANKSVHFNILTVFAIVFVCVYLYFAISDMKKLAVEVKKNAQDVTSIVTTLGTLTKELSELKKKVTSTTAPNFSGAKVPNVVITPQPQVAVAEQKVSKDVQPVTEDDACDDSDSIDTNDVKQLLSDIPDAEDGDDDAHDDDLQMDAVDDILGKNEETPEKPQQDITVTYKSLTLEQLKDKCREKGLSIKGNKDTLVQRLLSV